MKYQESASQDLSCREILWSILVNMGILRNHQLGRRSGKNIIPVQKALRCIHALRRVRKSDMSSICFRWSSINPTMRVAEGSKKDAMASLNTVSNWPRMARNKYESTNYGIVISPPTTLLSISRSSKGSGKSIFIAQWPFVNFLLWTLNLSNSTRIRSPSASRELILVTGCT